MPRQGRESGRSRNEAMFSVMHNAMDDKTPENLTHEEVMAQRGKAQRGKDATSESAPKGDPVHFHLQQIEHLRQSVLGGAEHLHTTVTSLCDAANVLVKENADLKQQVAELEVKVAELEQRILNESCKPDRAEEFRRKAMEALEKLSLP